MGDKEGFFEKRGTVLRIEFLFFKSYLPIACKRPTGYCRGNSVRNTVPQDFLKN